MTPPPSSEKGIASIGLAGRFPKARALELALGTLGLLW